MKIHDKNGERQVCDRCHRVRGIEIRVGTVCDDCRGIVGLEIVQPKPRALSARARKYAGLRGIAV